MQRTGLTNVDFSLISLVVPQDFGKGSPVSRLINNRSSKEMLTPFLGAIKKKCAENFEINALMRKNLLCKWHIVRTWRRKI